MNYNDEVNGIAKLFLDLACKSNPSIMKDDIELNNEINGIAKRYVNCAIEIGKKLAQRKVKWDSVGGIVKNNELGLIITLNELIDNSIQKEFDKISRKYEIPILFKCELFLKMKLYA